MPAGNLTDDIRKRSTWSVFMGVLTAIVGVFLIVYPLATATITTLLLGWLLIFVGIAQFVFALHSQTVRSFFMKLLLGLLYAIAGASLAMSPLAGVAALTLLIGILLLVQAGVVTAVAFQMRPLEGWGWFLVDAAATLLMGILILARWPASSFWAIGTLVGVAVLMSGICRIAVAAKIRGTTGDAQRLRAA